MNDQCEESQSLGFSDDEVASVYKAIFSRRDVRGQFKQDPVPDEILSRILYAAHHAPSVGFMQPWNFLVIKSADVKKKVYDAFEEANNEAKEMFEGEKKALYSSLKLQGILDSPVNICITCDRERVKGPVLGRTHIMEMDLYSTACAAQNLWLAARAEGVGVGWVSIVKQKELQQVLGIPENIIPVAYLCVGYVKDFYQSPELQIKGWRKRLPLEELVYFDQWEQADNKDALFEQLVEDKDFPSKSLD